MIHVVVPSNHSSIMATRQQNNTTAQKKQAEPVYTPGANVKSEGEGWRLELAAPGLEKSSFQLNVEGSILTVEATYTSREEEGVKALRREFGYGKLRRSFRLPDNADTSAISARYEAGILYVSVPKKAVFRVARRVLARLFRRRPQR